MKAVISLFLKPTDYPKQMDSTDYPEQMHTTYSSAIYTTVTPVTGSLVVILNIIELVCISKLQKRSRKIIKSFTYITSLCVSDIMVGLVMIALKCMHPFMETSLKGDAVAIEMYEIVRFVLLRLSMMISVFNLLALTYDRYAAITNPFVHRQRGRTFSTVIVVLVWLVSVLCVVSVYCVSRFKLGHVEMHNNLVFPVSSYLTTVVFIACYAVIYMRIRRHDKERRRWLTTDIMTIKNNNNSKSGKKLHQIKVFQKPDGFQRRFLRLAVTTVSVFCLTWLPLATCYVMKADGCSCGGKNVESTLFLLAFSNSLINPFVYFVYNRRNVFKFITKRVSTRLNLAGKLDTRKYLTSF